MLHEKASQKVLNEKAAKSATIRAVPTCDNGYSWVIECDDGDVQYLSSIGAPQGGSVGDRGRLAYVSAPSRGYWHWERCP